MKLRYCAVLLLVLLAACSGNDNLPADRSETDASLAAPLISEDSAGAGIFNAALPQEGHFNPSRVPAVSSLSKAGSDFNSASANVAANTGQAAYSPAGELEYAIWRFDATPDDSIGQLHVEIANAEIGARYWTGVADYSTGHWDWQGLAQDGANFEAGINGSPGQHSSPAGYIYVAVLTDGVVNYSVASITLQYLDRYNVSGVVLDLDDQPLSGVLVTTNLNDPQPVLSGLDGSFTLNGIPNGNWAVMATLRNYGFNPDMTMVNVDNADVAGITLRGFPRTFGFPDDEYEPNDLPENATQLNEAVVQDATISAYDDETDCYRFPVEQAGWHYLQLRADDEVLYPHMYMQTDLFSEYIDGYNTIRGANWLGYYFPVKGDYNLEVSCEGGGGHYSLELLDGRCAELELLLTDSGDPNDGDDGIHEQLHNTAVNIDFGDISAMLSGDGYGGLYHGFMPPRQATITPRSESYTFDPAEILHDFSSSDLLGFDLNLSADPVLDPMEPNNDLLSATALTLPLATPVSGYIGGGDLTTNDLRDYFSFDVPDGSDMIIRVHQPELDGRANGYAGIFFFDDNDVQVPGLNYNHGSYSEVRTQQPLPAGSYYMYLEYSGELDPYELEVIAFPRRTLSAHFAMNGKDLDYGLMIYEITGGGITESIQYASPGINVYGPFMDGELVHVRYEYNGLSFDPPEEWFTFNGSDVVLEPQISVDEDQYEPNDFAEDPFVVNFPAEFDATISAVTDYADYYGIVGLAAGPVKLTLTPDRDDVALECWVEKTAGSAQLGYHKARGAATFYFSLPDTDDYTFAVIVSNGETAYNMKIENSPPVHLITGNLDNGNVAEGYGGTQMVNLTNGDVYVPFDNTYSLGPYPDGEYDIHWFTSNHTLNPPGVVTVSISGADVVQDFTASYVDQDNMEPNDSPGSAAVLGSIPFSFSATLDSDNDLLPSGYDRRDYYMFVPAQDGMFEIIVTPLFSGLEEFQVALIESTFGDFVNYGKLIPATGGRVVGYEVKSGETYFLYVNANDDIRYSVTGDFLP